MDLIIHHIGRHLNERQFQTGVTNLKYFGIILIGLIVTTFFIKSNVAKCDTSSLFENEKPLFSNPHSEKLNHLLSKEFAKRLPTNCKFELSDFEPLCLYHNMLLYVDAKITLPELTITEVKEAIAISAPYFQALFDTMNNTREIRPYLDSFPYSLDRCQLYVEFARNTKPHDSLAPKNICCVTLCHFPTTSLKIYPFPNNTSGQDRYFDPPHSIDNGEFGDLPDIFKQMNTPHYDSTIPLQPIEISQAEKYVYFNNQGKDEFQFAVRFAKQQNMKCIAIRDACTYEQPKQMNLCSSLAYAAQEMSLTLEQARDLVIKTRSIHADFYRKSGKLQECVKVSRKSEPGPHSKTVDAQKYLAFRLSFWDKYLDRVKAPSIAEVRVYGKRARYYVADELQRLQLLHEEELPAYDVDVPIELQKQSAPK